VQLFFEHMFAKKAPDKFKNNVNIYLSTCVNLRFLVLLSWYNLKTKAKSEKTLYI